MVAGTRFDEQMKTFTDMVKRLGIDPVALSRDALGRTLVSAMGRCGACSAGAMCRDWLASAAPRSANAPPFCRNRDIFARAHRLS